MNKFILDASFILSTILELRPEAFKRLEEILQQTQQSEAQIYSLHLLPLEVANGLRFEIKNIEQAKIFLEKFYNLPIDYFSLSHTQVKEILTLSYKYKTSIYDSSYHFLALLLDGTFITCDRKYYQKAKKLKHIDLVI